MKLSVPCSTSARRIAASTASAAETWPLRMAAARAVASGHGEAGGGVTGGVTGGCAAGAATAWAAARAIGDAARARRVIMTRR